MLSSVKNIITETSLLVQSWNFAGVIVKLHSIPGGSNVLAGVHLISIEGHF